MPRFFFALWWVVLAASACVTTVAVPPSAPPLSAPPLIEPFYSELDPWGDWWWSERYGWVFTPDVEVGWRPYVHGHWEFTSDHGWVWVSAERFGWACFHYGRWFFADDAGWTWIPDTTWGPGWVEWRNGPGLIGWAPLGPVGVVVVPWGWAFVDERALLAPDLVVVVWPPHHNHRGLERSRVIHRPSRDHRSGDRDRDQDGPDRRDVERATGAVVVPRVVDDRSAPDHLEVRRIEQFDRVPAASERRVLRAPADADVDGYWQGQRTRVSREHDEDRRVPPKDVKSDELERRHRADLDADREREDKEKAALKKKKEKPRSAVPKKPSPGRFKRP
ncbi:MAG: hypothetical protein Q8O67_11310 [Deltaproteobacteria bacterium]|nr:hypothetical protein [Deltaproteobacteria bacterium]